MSQPTFAPMNAADKSIRSSAKAQVVLIILKESVNILLYFTENAFRVIIRTVNISIIYIVLHTIRSLLRQKA